MAVLSDAIRKEILAQFMRDKSALREMIATIGKPDLLAAVNAVESWIDANSAAFNTPCPWRPAMP